jgi:large subunit ribosomal protein L29
MELEKLINLTDAELKQQELTSAEQLFRLRFQKSLGNNEGLKKLKTLKLDIARIKTIARQRELGIVTTVRAVKTAKPAKVKAEAAVKPAAKAKVAKAEKAPAAAKKTTAKKAKKD